MIPFTNFESRLIMTSTSIRFSVALGLFAVLLLPAPAQAAATSFAAMGCLIEPERTTDVGSPVVGVVERIEVERGQSVRRGQVLAVLRASVERANLTVASSRAESDAEYKAAAASAKFNRERLLRAEDLFHQQFISQQALDQTRTESRLADHKLAQANDQRDVSQREREVAAAQLLLRVIRSPMDGVVAERYVTAGERVDDKPLLRIARVDPLRVQLVVPIGLYGQVQTGGQASVLPELPGAAPKLARVTLIDKVVDSASNTFRVQLELPNADHGLPAGLRCKADFAVQALPPPASVQAAPPPASPATGPAARSAAKAQAVAARQPLQLTAALAPDAQPAPAAPAPRRVALRHKPKAHARSGHAVPAGGAAAPAADADAPAPDHGSDAPAAAAGATHTALVAEPATR